MHDHSKHHAQAHDQGKHGHRHSHDSGFVAGLRYLRLMPMMWRSTVSTEIVRDVAPKSTDRVVDLGAGMGAATFEAVRTGATVIAVDPAPYMRGVLKLRRRWPGHGRVTVVDGAAESIPVADASIDALWTSNTIHHWTDRTKASHELARAVRPGGRVLLVDEDMSDPKHPWYDEARSRQRKQHFDEVDAAEIAAGLRAAGFKSADGALTTFAGRPAKVIRAIR